MINWEDLLRVVVEVWANVADDPLCMVVPWSVVVGIEVEELVDCAVVVEEIVVVVPWPVVVDTL